MQKHVAFDIDGTLTTDEGMSKFWEYQFDGDYTVGIISARPMTSIEQFIEDEGLTPMFVESTLMKNRAMDRIADEGIYYGDRMVDKGYARMAGWEFRGG